MVKPTDEEMAVTENIVFTISKGEVFHIKGHIGKLKNQLRGRAKSARLS